jgi:hypothetical protein
MRRVSTSILTPPTTLITSRPPRSQKSTLIAPFLSVYLDNRDQTTGLACKILKKTSHPTVAVFYDTSKHTVRGACDKRKNSAGVENERGNKLGETLLEKNQMVAIHLFTYDKILAPHCSEWSLGVEIGDWTY